jgi:hypothetical protein
VAVANRYRRDTQPDSTVLRFIADVEGEPCSGCAHVHARIGVKVRYDTQDLRVWYRCRDCDLIEARLLRLTGLILRHCLFCQEILFLTGGCVGQPGEFQLRSTCVVCRAGFIDCSIDCQDEPVLK